MHVNVLASSACVTLGGTVLGTHIVHNHHAVIHGRTQLCAGGHATSRMCGRLGPKMAEDPLSTGDALERHPRDFHHRSRVRGGQADHPLALQSQEPRPQREDPGVLGACHVEHRLERAAVLVEQAGIRRPAILRAARVDVGAGREGPLHDAARAVGRGHPELPAVEPHTVPAAVSGEPDVIPHRDAGCQALVPVDLQVEVHQVHLDWSLVGIAVVRQDVGLDSRQETIHVLFIGVRPIQRPVLGGGEVAVAKQVDEAQRAGVQRADLGDGFRQAGKLLRLWLIVDEKAPDAAAADGAATAFAATFGSTQDRLFAAQSAAISCAPRTVVTSSESACTKVQPAARRLPYDVFVGGGSGPPPMTKVVWRNDEAANAAVGGPTTASSSSSGIANISARDAAKFQPRARAPRAVGPAVNYLIYPAS
jgi:hypothetical protein